MKDLDKIIESGESDNLIIDIDAEKDWQEQFKRLQALRYGSDTQDRKWLAKWTAGVVTLWLLAVLIVLAFNKCWNMGLSDTVLITLLGTTTLNVLGLSFIVLRGHFNSVHSNK